MISPRAVWYGSTRERQYAVTGTYTGSLIIYDSNDLYYIILYLRTFYNHARPGYYFGKSNLSFPRTLALYKIRKTCKKI